MALSDLARKSLLAGGSGALVPLGQSLIALLPDDGGYAYWLLFIAASGSVFAAGVLLPYLKRDRFIGRRVAAAVVISSGSFWAAYSTVDYLLGMRRSIWSVPTTGDYVAASLVGAAIVLITTKFIAPLRTNWRYWVLGVFTSLVSGMLFSLSKGAWLGSISYAQWHLMLAITLHFGTRTSTRPDSSVESAG